MMIYFLKVAILIKIGTCLHGKKTEKSRPPSAKRLIWEKWNRIPFLTNAV